MTTGAAAATGGGNNDSNGGFLDRDGSNRDWQQWQETAMGKNNGQ